LRVRRHDPARASRLPDVPRRGLGRLAGRPLVGAAGPSFRSLDVVSGRPLKTGAGLADGEGEVASPSRQHALFELGRDLSSALELDEIARRFAAHAHALTGGDARIWLLAEGPRRLVLLGADPTERELADDAPEQAVIRSRRPLRTASLFILPLTTGERAIGVIEVDGASAAQLASGGMQFWRTVGETVGTAVEGARRHERLVADENRFRSLVEEIPVVTYIDQAGTGEPIYVSPQIDRVMGVPAAEWLANPDEWTRRIHPEDREIAVDLYRRTVETGERFSAEYRVIDLEGRTRWFHDEALAVRPGGGRSDEIHGVVYEITERKQAEEAMRISERALSEAERRYRTLVEQLPLAIYIDALDEAGTSLYNSPQNEVITGYTHAEWQADPDLFAKIIHEDDRRRVLEGFEAARVDGTPFASEYRVVRRDGTMVWVHDECVIVRDESGRPVYRQGYLLDVTQRKEAEERLGHLAYHDSLTGLPNRDLFSEHLDVALARALPTGQGVAVLYVDLDDFKLVNDSLGHGAGDELLIEVARRLRGAVRSSDIVARQSGDEFLILVADLDVNPGSDIADVARRVAENLREALSTPFDLAGTEVYCSGSVGISLYPVDAVDGESLLKHADAAMYRAKESGRDGHQVYTRDGGDAMARLSMAGRLRRAAAREEFVLHYQPLVDLATATAVGVEALIRWMDGDRGLIMPGQFIPLAERTGLIGPISEWVVEEACRQGRAWRDAGLDLYVSVNLPAAFWEPTAMRHVLDTIDSFGLSPDRMMIEITESTVARETLHGAPILAEIHERGLRLAIDDFGIGESSLGRLQQMSVTTLKIDRSFVSGLPDDHGARVLVSGMIGLADGLGLQALAEGIETEAQRAFLIDHGCPLGQGYLFSPPVPAEQIEPLVRQLPRAA
jgi:diguanylate cyclase (GGDEF)-like protein/PAS domain S-box-containing protein